MPPSRGGGAADGLGLGLGLWARARALGSGSGSGSGLWALGSGSGLWARARAVGFIVSRFKWLTKFFSIFRDLQDIHTFAPLGIQKFSEKIEDFFFLFLEFLLKNPDFRDFCRKINRKKCFFDENCKNTPVELEENAKICKNLQNSVEFHRISVELHRNGDPSAPLFGNLSLSNIFSFSFSRFFFSTWFPARKSQGVPRPGPCKGQRRKGEW